MYSGNQLIGSVVLSTAAQARLDPQLQVLAEQSGDLHRIYLDDWSIAATNVPSYPAARVLRRVARSFCPVYIDVDDVTFVLEQPAAWFYRPGWHRLETGALLCR
jgi:hypothetical protein